MVITLCNQKGGSGKTTMALLLALALEDIGYAVRIVDRDLQRTASRAMDNLRKKKLSTVECIQSPTKEPRTVTLIDTAPRLDATLSRSVAESDRVILISSPSPADLWSTQDSREFVQASLPKAAKCAILFNSVVRGSKISRDLPALAELIGLPALKNYMTRRQPYQYAILQGWAALKSPERDEIKNAALEISML